MDDESAAHVFLWGVLDGIDWHENCLPLVVMGRGRFVSMNVGLCWAGSQT